MSIRLLIAAGGTGGHFYPGLAVLEAMRARAEVEPMFVGTARGIEARAVPALGYPLTLVDVSPLNGVRGVALARALGKLPLAALECIRTLARFRPHAVLSVGGYASGPITALAALAPRVVTALVEPNAVPGLTNLLLAPAVSRAYLTYPETARYFRRDAARVYGSPVRKQFVERAAATGDTRRARMHVLAFGGSQGARALNRALPGAVALARAAGADFTIMHQTGAAEHISVENEYRARGLEGVEVVAFIDDMAAAMARADLLVCRAGAGTIAEMCVMGRPAIMVPLPSAADDHQRKNAEAVAARGAGVCLEQKDLNETTLGAQLAALLSDSKRLAQMAEQARALGVPDAAERVADDLLAAVQARFPQAFARR